MVYSRYVEKDKSVVGTGISCLRRLKMGAKKQDPNGQVRV